MERAIATTNGLIKFNVEKRDFWGYKSFSKLQIMENLVAEESIRDFW